jgi:hypothetical protein
VGGRALAERDDDVVVHYLHLFLFFECG